MKRNLIILVILIIVQVVVVVWYAQGLADPKYSFIGDEYSFYQFAFDIATEKVAPNIFSQDGVYQTNPTMGSYYQAALMRVFGINIYGWKLSSIIIIIPLGILMFYLLRGLSGFWVGLFGLVAIDTSHYFYTFFQIGYVNNLSLLCLVIILCLLPKISKENTSLFWFVLIGIVAGLSWYFYIGKLFAALVGGYILLCRVGWKRTIAYAIPVAALIAIGFICTPSNPGLHYGLTKTILYKEFDGWEPAIRNILYPWILQWRSPSMSHYLSMPAYVDKITAILCGLGLLLILARKRDMYFRYLVLFAIVIILIGITTPYAYPATARGIHYVPFYIIFAAYPLSLVVYKKIQPALCTIVLVGIVILNVLSVANNRPQSNPIKEVFTYLQTNQGMVYLVKNELNLNAYVIETMNHGYLLDNKVSVTREWFPSSCEGQDYIISTTPPPCPCTQVAGYWGVTICRP